MFVFDNRLRQLRENGIYFVNIKIYFMPFSTCSRRTEIQLSTENNIFTFMFHPQALIFFMNGGWMRKGTDIWGWNL